VWKRQSSHNDAQQGSKHFGRIHDTILVYTKSKKYAWNQQYVPYDDIYVERTYKYVESETERRYALGDLTGPGGAAKNNPMYEFLGVKRYWRYSKITMRKLLTEGRIVHKKDRVPLLKRYLDEMEGKPLQDVWTDIKLDCAGKIKFPTQKPEALLERIINISSNRGQLVYDPFSGSGTSGSACFKLSRRWVASEILEDACHLSLERLEALGCNVMSYSESQLSSSSRISKPQGSNCFRRCS
jgi:adenine specific DNA methylase Mod